MTAREFALETIKIAGYHNDVKTFTQVFVLSRLSREAANQAFITGQTMKENGVKCDCEDCIN